MLTAVLLGMVALAAAYVLLTWNRDYSSTPLPAITASRDPDIVARGEYLVNSVAHCPFCHGDPARKPGEPLVPSHRVSIRRFRTPARTTVRASSAAATS